MMFVSAHSRWAAIFNELSSEGEGAVTALVSDLQSKWAEVVIDTDAIADASGMRDLHLERYDQSSGFSVPGPTGESNFAVTGNSQAAHAAGSSSPYGGGHHHDKERLSPLPATIETDDNTTVL